MIDSKREKTFEWCAFSRIRNPVRHPGGRHSKVFFMPKIKRHAKSVIPMFGTSFPIVP